MRYSRFVVPSAAQVREWLLGVLRKARVMGYRDVEDLIGDLRDEDETIPPSEWDILDAD